MMPAYIVMSEERCGVKTLQKPLFPSLSLKSYVQTAVTLLSGPAKTSRIFGSNRRPRSMSLESTSIAPDAAVRAAGAGMSRSTLAAFILISLGAGARVEAAQPSEESIRAARTEIARMGEPELRSLLNYFAECTDRTSLNQAVRQACKSAFVKYQTEFGGKRTVDKLIAEQEELGEIQRTFRATGQSTDSSYVETVDRQLRQAVGDALKANSSR
ncbi:MULTISPECIES: hypothetical protein [unclassified Bradyrhizobium]|uniref:hypothetical protein n=1 Tax=Bradyrhizobium sp. USDA 4541 TaxID=2817704 RepID=UPI0020A36B37|nr:hypothetical protein [Bradyrhizobium sp. USDA 4541]MCP1852857.1 hypothetical protein [Bradyrhizobium sp. USDA 4541]